MARKKRWTPNPEILKAVEGVIARMSPVERQKKIAILGFSKRGRAFTIEELLDEYRRGSKLGCMFQHVLITNTVDRLVKGA